MSSCKLTTISDNTGTKDIMYCGVIEYVKWAFFSGHHFIKTYMQINKFRVNFGKVIQQTFSKFKNLLIAKSMAAAIKKNKHF